MTTNTEQTVVVRSLRELDALVAERLMGWKWFRRVRQPSEYELLDQTQDSIDLELQRHLTFSTASPYLSGRWDWRVPHYTTWEKLEFVIQNREEAGFTWRLEKRSPYGDYAATLESLESGNYWFHFCQDKSVAFNIAALASAGCRVRLELGEGAYD